MEKEKRICLRSRDFNFIMYLSEYGIITNENVKLFYDSKYYYKNRLASLAKGEFIERLYGKVVLGRKGKSYLNEIGLGYRNINRNETYKKRMERISDVSCKVQLAGWVFEPSWRCSVNTYTKRGNRFIGVMSREKRHWGESDEDYMKNRIINIFGENIYRVKGYIYEIYCKKEENLYTYIFPMHFADFSIMDWINYIVDSSIHGDIKCKVVCNEFCIEEVKNFLKDKVEVICLMEQ